MKSLTKYLSVLGFLFFHYSSFGQSTVRSIYNIYGVGSLNQIGLGQYESMGYTGVAARSVGTVNLENPASLNAIKGVNHILDMGFYHTNTVQRTFESSFSSQSGNMGSINYWFSSGTKSAFSFGAGKYSDASYDISDFNNSTTALGTYDSRYIGDGGISQIYVAGSREVFKNLNIGARANFLFGSFSRTEIVSLENFESSLIFDDSKRFAKAVLDGGLQYTIPFQNERSITLGSTLRQGVDVDISEETYIIEDETDSLYTEGESTIHLPRQIGLGISYLSPKWQLSLDYQVENWSKNPEQQNYSYNDRHIVSIGGAFQKDRRSIEYKDRIVVRFGAGVQSNYISVDEVDFLSSFYSVGLGLPLTRGSQLNIGYQYFQNGTLTDDLIIESSHKLSLNISISDIWFRKRFYD